MLKSLVTAYKLIDDKTRYRLPIAFIIMLMLSALEVLGISLVFPLIQGVMNGEKFLGNSIFSSFFSFVNIQKNQHLMLIIASSVFGLFILKNILSIFLTRWQVKFLAEADYSLSTMLMKRYMRMPYVNILSMNSVDMARNIMNVVSSACSGFLGSALIISTELVMIVGIVFMLFIFSPMVMMSVGIFMASMAWLFQSYVKEKILKSGQAYLYVTTKAWKDIVQTFLVIKDLHILGREEKVFDKFCKLRKDLLEIEVTQKFTQFLPRLFLEIVFSMAALIFCIFLFKFQKGDASSHLALLGVVGVAFVRLIPSINRILAFLQTVRANIPAVLALNETLVTSESIKNENYENLSNFSERGNNTSGLALNNIYYTYPNREQAALNNINLSINWGESLGLVGGSGAGKSTLVDIILGLLKPSSGQLLLNGEDIFKHLDAWHKKIGYVPQNIYLCDDSILHNIALGLSDEEINQEQLAKAIKLANVEHFIQHLPEGLNTIIGEQGVQLSGGQRQCIGIARALYNDPSILILDEATSSLDNESEHRINDMLEKLYKEKTLIIVAHRLSTVRRCDKIVFMETGQISGIGTFAVLQAEHAGFRRLVELGTL